MEQPPRESDRASECRDIAVHHHQHRHWHPMAQVDIPLRAHPNKPTPLQAVQCECCGVILDRESTRRYHRMETPWMHVRGSTDMHHLAAICVKDLSLLDSSGMISMHLDGHQNHTLTS